MFFASRFLLSKLVLVAVFLVLSGLLCSELAFRMQMGASGVFDLAGESERTLESYGVGKKNKFSYKKVYS